MATQYHKLHYACYALILALLCGCQAPYPPSPGERGVAFPLVECSYPEKTGNGSPVKQAAAQLLIQAPYIFSSANTCVTGIDRTPVKDSPLKGQSASQREKTAYTSSEQLHTIIEQPFLKQIGIEDPAKPSLGLALSGGGSKAAAFGVGVLAGLSDAQILDSVDLISSVSGGSYAAYYFYSHKIFPESRHHQVIPSNYELFVSPENIGQVAKENMVENTNGNESGRFQKFLSCKQDIFLPRQCSFEPDGNYGELVVPMVMSVPSAPFSWVANSIFDWGINISPTADVYESGIGVGFGSSPKKNFDFTQSKPEIDCHSSTGNTTDCEPHPLGDIPVKMTFDELRMGMLKAAEENRRLPFWIINATAVKRRSIFGWGAHDPKEITLDDRIFEMTPLSHGSAMYGYVSSPPSLHNLKVLDAVTASSAFLDSNERKYFGVKGFMEDAGLKLLNADWGIDIRNYNVADSRLPLHRILPFPLNTLDSLVATHTIALPSDIVSGSDEAKKYLPEEADRLRSVYIRLIDGGNSEDLGIYSLIKRHTRTIIISDAAHDDGGMFEDVCVAERNLKDLPENVDVPHYLYVPELKDFSEHCNKLENGNEAKGYNLYNWNYRFPVLLGCIKKKAVSNPDDEASACNTINPEDDIRLLIIKPALNMPIWAKQHNYNIEEPTPDALHAIPSNYLGDVIGTFIKNNWRQGHNVCEEFPQDSTVTMTFHSDAYKFSAYRELARQYVTGVEDQENIEASISGIREFIGDDLTAIRNFEAAAKQQGKNRMDLEDVSQQKNICRHVEKKIKQVMN